MAGRLPEEPTLIYDDDHYYMASVIAELLATRGIATTLVTPEVMLSSWSAKTNEHGRVQRRLLELGVRIITSRRLIAYDGARAQIECGFTGDRQAVAAGAVVTVTQRQPDDALYHDIEHALAGKPGYRPRSLDRIGDCLAPSIIAAAVYSGHRYARELGTEIDPDNRMQYDRVQVG